MVANGSVRIDQYQSMETYVRAIILLGPATVLAVGGLRFGGKCEQLVSLVALAACTVLVSHLLWDEIAIICS
jgi:hypothetical protein